MKKRALLTVGLGYGALACATILGIETRPISDLSDASDANVVTESDAATTGCTVSYVDEPMQGCSKECPHDFCDDFDDGVQPIGGRWISSFTQGGGAFFIEKDAGAVHMSLVEAGVSPPNAYRVTIDGVKGQFALLLRSLTFDGGVPSGARLRFSARVAELALTDPLGPFDGGVTILGGVFRESIPPAGVAFVVGANALLVAASDKDLEEPEVIAVINDDLDLTKLNRLTGFEIVVSAKDKLSGENATACATVAGAAPTSTAVAIVRVAAFPAVCIGLPGTLTDLSWVQAVGLGSIPLGGGRSDVMFDSVFADFLR